MVSKEIFTVLAGCGISVGVTPHHIATHTDNLIFPDVEVHTERTRRRNTIIAPETAETVAVSETKLIGIIEIAEQCELVAVPEAVHIKGSHITVIRAVSSFHCTEPTLVHAFFYRKIDDSLVLAIIHAGQARHVTLAVHHLELINHIDRQILRGHLRVIAEKLLSVNKNLGHLPAIGGNFTITVNLYTGETLQKVLHHGIGLSVI